jgi:GDP-4-dehydro-6-deoxy-D-mannose reductase
LRGAEAIKIVTGNPNTRRDFTDVRDVVQAYQLLAGETKSDIYNVSSGRSISAAEQVRLVAELIAPIAVEHAIDPARFRAHEVADLRGAHARLSDETGWNPEIPFRQMMLDTIDWWERELSAPAPTRTVRN